MPNRVDYRPNFVHFYLWVKIFICHLSYWKDGNNNWNFKVSLMPKFKVFEFSLKIMLLFIKDTYFLTLKVFKSLKHLNPEFIRSYFNRKQIRYDLRNGFKLFITTAKSFCLRLNYLHFRGSILWNNFSSSVKNKLT